MARPPEQGEGRGHVPSGSCHESGTPASWDERYSTRGMVWGTEPNQFLAEFAAGLSPRRVLDLGCGQGRNAVWLAKQGHTVTGVDQSRVGIDQSRQLAEQQGAPAEFVLADLAGEWTPPPESCDLAVLSYLQLPPGPRRTVHAKAAAALAPGGDLFLIAHHADNLEHGAGGPPYPEVLFDEAGLAEDFAALDIRINEKRCREVEGEGGAVCRAVDLMLVAVKPAQPSPRM